ncbi:MULTISPECIES: RusA family crossover junction endodeoxyribonuclease [unclassified Bradyrhizobium]|uniref:RusA family crossover junction endodeoxyribonuclease n=1 Tax=unclassified Bradyrhizobium TaxID=2631580 RepID=UPI0028EB1C34|nr:MULTISPECIES: hypothetical protein [unclassified Bradyrhizobium]
MSNIPSFADAPFHCPADIVLDLPPPVSVNRIWRARKAGKKRVRISPEYAAWKIEADKLSIATGAFRGLKPIRGKFEAQLIIRRRNGDLDNFSKGVLDWLQSRAVIVNDKFCERLVVEWGEAPAGARVIVKPLGTDQ